MSAILVIPDHIADKLQTATGHPLETAGVLLVSVVETPDDSPRLLAREVIWVEDSAYARRESNSLSIASHGYIRALGRAEELGATAIWFHTHPGMDSRPTPSEHDDLVDDQIADLFRLRSGSSYYGALIMAPRSGSLSQGTWIRMMAI
jgi:hypothetical protein